MAVSIGLVAMVFAWALGLLAGGAPLTPAALWELHLANPVIWITDLAPLVLAVGAWFSHSASTPEPAAAPAMDPEQRVFGAIAQSVLEATLDGVILVGGDERIRFVNGAVERIFGHKRDALIGGTLETVIPKHRDQESTVSTYRRTGHDAVLGVEWRMEGRHRDGKEFPLELTDIPIDVDGELVHVFQLRDITERLAQEEKMRKVNKVLSELRDQALMASRAKSAFLANMSHELRTPLNAILGYSEMLREEVEDLGHADLAPDLTKINSAGRHLLALINSILDLSKIEAGKMELYMETSDVRRVVGEVEELARPLAARNDNVLVVECDPSVGRMVTDVTKLRQVLLNLLSNAC